MVWFYQEIIVIQNHTIIIKLMIFQYFNMTNLKLLFTYTNGVTTSIVDMIIIETISQTHTQNKILLPSPHPLFQ